MIDSLALDLSGQNERIIPASLSVQASIGSERIFLSGYCISVTRVVAAIYEILEQTGGSTIRCVVETEELTRHLSMELQLPALSMLETMRRAIHSAGGIIERLQIDYGIRPIVPAQRLGSNSPVGCNSWYDAGPKPCMGCHYYHGQQYGGKFLVCAVHPGGPEEENCRDRLDLEP